MSVEIPTDEYVSDVLGVEFCTGYLDSFGNWNNGFYCPQYNYGPAFCCGTEFFKYCCSKEDVLIQELEELPLILGAMFAALAASIGCVVFVCFCCACCPLYKKRHFIPYRVGFPERSNLLDPDNLSGNAEPPPSYHTSLGGTAVVVIHDPNAPSANVTTTQSCPQTFGPVRTQQQQHEIAVQLPIQTYSTDDSSADPPAEEDLYSSTKF
jgi:hypothetical protein